MSRRAEVVAWLAALLERPESDLHDDFDVVSDHDWSRADPDDYGFVFEDLIRRFGIHDQRFDFGRTTAVRGSGGRSPGTGGASSGTRPWSSSG